MANNTAFDDVSDVDERRSQYLLDSDEESLIDVQSPADGYFTQRNHPQDTFVENPSQASEIKAREAARERQLATSVPLTVGTQASATDGRPDTLDEAAPMLDAGPAPPDYYQATAGRRDLPQLYPQEQVRDTSYGTMVPPSSSQEHDRPSQNPVPFNSDHPLVRNGLFSEQGVPSSESQAPQSMSDHNSRQPQAPAPSLPHRQPPDTSQHNPTTVAGSVERTANQDSTDSESHGTDSESNGTDEESNGTDEGSHGTDEESHGVLPKWHRDHRHHHHGFKKKQTRWRKFFSSRKACLKILFVIALIIIIVLATSPSQSSDYYGDNPHSKLPVDSPESPPESKLPIPDHHNTAQCTYDSASMYESFDFQDPGSFSFLEMIESSSLGSVYPAGTRIGGKIKVAPFSRSSKNDENSKNVAIRVSVHVASTKPWSIKKLKFSKDEDGIQLGFPEVTTRPSNSLFGLRGWSRPCVDFAVLIQVRKDVRIQNWDITTANLDVEVEDGLFSDEDEPGTVSDEDESAESVRGNRHYSGLSVMNDTSIYAIRGSIKVAYWNSRRTRISTHSSSISGTYALRDLLEVESHSGTVDIDVPPKKADDEDPLDAPADLIVKTHSGSVRVNCPEDQFDSDIPVRQYRTRVETQSSQLSGRYLLGTSASFTSHSGQIAVSVRPISSNAWKSSLYTSTMSGQTRLKLREALTANSKWDMGSISSNHKSHSGQLLLEYPARWTGKVEGRSHSGRIDVRGKDVEIIGDEHGSGYHKITAKKGSGDSSLTFKTMSSSVDVLIGEED